MEKRLIIALSVSLGLALLAIAFLAGRMTTPAPVVMGHESQPAHAAPAVAAQQTEQPSVKVRDTAPPSQAEALVHEPPPPAREPVLSTAQVIQPARPTQPVQPARPPQASVIASYFAKIDAIHVAGSGDPTTFAQGIVGGIQAGDTSGLDSLVDSAKLALTQATAVQPPPACAEYHRRLLEVMSESAAGMDKIRSALKKGDITDIAALATQFQATQQKVDDLERMKKQLLGQ